MVNSLRTSFMMALLVLTCVGSAAATDTASKNPGLVADARGLAARAFGRLPESGALLLWGTGLAVASRAVARKRDDS